MYFEGKVHSDILFGVCADYVCAKDRWEKLASTKAKPIWIPSLSADEMAVYREFEKEEARLDAVCYVLGLSMDNALNAYHEYDAGEWSNAAETAACRRSSTNSTQRRMNMSASRAGSTRIKED